MKTPVDGRVKKTAEGQVSVKWRRLQ